MAPARRDGSVALFCPERGKLIENAARVLGDGLRADHRVLAIVETASAQTLLALLASDGHDVGRLQRAGQLAIIDGRELLAGSRAGDEAAIEDLPRRIAALVEQDVADLRVGQLLHAFNELPALLWERGQRVAAVEAETLWEEQQQLHGPKLRAHHAIAGFFKSSQAAPHAVASALTPEELERRAEIEEALREALARSRAKLASLRSTRDVSDRRQAEDELRGSEERLQRIADALPVLISFVDKDMRYQFVNATYERWFGIPRAEILGKQVEEVLGADAFARAGPHMASALAGTVGSYEAELPYLHGGARAVQATYLPDLDPRTGKVAGYIGLVSDISERRRLETLRASAALRAEKLLKITAAVAGAVSSTQVFAALVDHVAESVQASSVGLWLLDPQAKVAHLARGTGYSEQARQQLESLPLDSASMPIVDALRSEAPIWISSQAELIERYPHLREMVSAGRSYRIACLPLVAEQRTLGVLGITIEQPGEADDEERDFLLLVARYASQALLRLRLLEAEQRSGREAVDARARAEQLYRFAQAVVEADRFEVVLDAAFVAIERALGTSRAAFLRADRNGIMRFKAWRGLSDAYRAAVDGHTPWADDDPAPAPVLVPDAQTEPSLSPYRELFQREGIGALAFVPLVSSGRLLGKFMLYYDTPHVFTRAEIETARAIANHLASVTVRYETVATLQETIRNNELLAGVLAHDLRNPLAAIMTAAHLVLTTDPEEGPSAANVKALGKILSSGGRMKAMIEQLLDFTRARSGGGIGIEPKQANLAELAAQALDELELTNPSWRIDRHVVGDPVGCWDADRVLQVVSNLAANAGQHGRAGGAIRVTVDGTQPHQVVLKVQNDGAVAARDAQELFDPFRTFGQPRVRSRGLGLGLFIVREIVEAHGGSVEVVSSEADGTTFVARFPRAAK